jgi:Methyltransferase domain
MTTLKEFKRPIPEIYKQYPVGRTRGGTEFINLMDDYLAYLSFANAGMLNQGNLLCFDFAIRNLPSKNPMLEIGSFCGLSTNIMTYFKRKHGVENKLFTCDKWEFEGAEGNVGASDIPHWKYREFVRGSFVRNAEMFSAEALPHTIEKRSEEFFEFWRAGITVTDVFGQKAKLGGPISFCFIDGNHGYEYALRDFLNTDEFLEPGGFVLFDDSADGSKWEVCSVIEEVKRMGTYEIAAQNPNYLFRKSASNFSSASGRRM